jgi:hypothetical protein
MPGRSAEPCLSLMHSIEQPSLLVWAPILGGLVIVWLFALAVDRALMQRGKSHAVVHGHHHGDMTS